MTAPDVRRGRLAVRKDAEAGALVEWWAELRAGYRTRYDFDALWRAACLEARARDAQRDGQCDAAHQDRLEAAAILLQADAEVAV